MHLPHLIYGTFPDLPGSQQVVYKSSGISDEVEQWLIQCYERFGDCKNENFQTAVCVHHFRNSESPVTAVTRISQFGRDFSGRWGALLRNTALLTLEDWTALGGDSSLVAAQLVLTGSADELRQSHELEIDESVATENLLAAVRALDFTRYESDLRRLISGERLTLYSEINTPALDDFVARLILLLPQPLRLQASWSQFAFQALPEFDLLVAHSSRYEAPSGDDFTFQTDGTNELLLTGRGVSSEDYIAELRLALSEDVDAPLLELLTRPS